MKTIDLKKYYHDPELYDESNLVVVTDEVAEVMDRSIMEEKSFYMRRYRAKAFYSLDYGNGIEHYVIFREESPEELYEKKLTMQQLNHALSKLPVKEGQHTYARYFLGKCDSFAGGKKSADKQQNTVVWITGNPTGGMTG